MTARNLEELTRRLVADGKGILAADESVATLTRRFNALRIPSTEQSRRAYREMLFTTPGEPGLTSSRSPTSYRRRSSSRWTSRPRASSTRCSKPSGSSGDG